MPFHTGLLIGLLIGCASLLYYRYNLTHNPTHDRMIRVGGVIKSRYIPNKENTTKLLRKEKLNV